MTLRSPFFAGMLFTLLAAGACGGNSGSTAGTSGSGGSAAAGGSGAMGGRGAAGGTGGFGAGAGAGAGGTSGAGAAGDSGTAGAGANAMLLSVSPTNPRYFQDAAGKIVYLTGSHNWHNFQDEGKVGGPLLHLADFNAYLDFLQSHGQNFARLWAYEGWEFCGSMTEPWYHQPLPYSRPGPGTALDGRPKFDLNHFDPAYFDRLRSDVVAADQRGVYVSIMLFQGWSVCSSGVWPGHPFNAANNINGVDGDLNHDGVGLEVHSLQDPAITALQDAYIRKVIDTVNDLGNVLYEISNEGDSRDVQWQDHMIKYVKNYEATKALQHPVGMTYNQQMTQSDMYDSPADWISPSGSWGYGSDPPAADGKKVILTDTDHIFGVGGDGNWVWKSFTRGLNPIYMDDFAQDPGEVSARRAMGDCRKYADKMDLAAMTPRGDLTSTGYALANPGKQYLVYDPSGGDFSADLSDASPADAFSVEWFDPKTSTASQANDVSGGASRTFTPPFSGAAVLCLRK